jgi:hypothetical protein
MLLTIACKGYRSKKIIREELLLWIQETSKALKQTSFLNKLKYMETA